MATPEVSAMCHHRGRQPSQIGIPLSGGLEAYLCALISHHHGF